MKLEKFLTNFISPKANLVIEAYNKNYNSDYDDHEADNVTEEYIYLFGPHSFKNHKSPARFFLTRKKYKKWLDYEVEWLSLDTILFAKGEKVPFLLINIDKEIE